MGQFVSGVILFIIPGFLPAYVRCGNKEKSVPARLVADTLCFAFLILVGTFGVLYALFGDVPFSIKNNPYVLLYVSCFVGAYGFSFVLALLAGGRRAGARRVDGRAGMFAVTGLWIILLAGLCYDDYAKHHIVINEVCSSNLTLALDQDGENSDYIELYNPSFTSVSLEGWYLTDQEESGEESRLCEMTIAPRSYLLLFANGDAGEEVDEETGESCYYLGFRLKESGETLTLSDGGGHMVDQVKLPSLDTDVSYARLPDGTDRWSVVKNGTPGESNEGLKGYVQPTLEPPAFSAGSGFYDEPFSLTLSAGEGERIYYTPDGSEPTAESTLYEEAVVIEDGSAKENRYAAIEGISRDGDYVPPQRIDKATVVKAVSVDEAGAVSEVGTEVYFVGFEEKEGYDGVKVLSLTGDPADFFSEDRGIYMLGDDYDEWLENYRDYREYEAYREQGFDWKYGSVVWRSFAANYTHPNRMKERMVTAVLFDKDRTVLGEERIGVRTRGGSSRNLRQKGFNFYARSEYGEDPLGFDAKMLRTSGSIDTNVTMLRDVFNQSLVADRALETQPGEPCVVFLNGEFWGVYNLQARFSDAYFEEKYGLDKDEVVVVKQDSRVSVGEEEDFSLYESLLSFAKKEDLSGQEAYEEIGRMMDIQSFIDHYCFEIYIGNVDWPLNNICCWRTREAGLESPFSDGRWRWGMYDTDESTGIYDTGMGTYDSDPFLEENHWFGSPLTTPLMSNLILNETFKKQFVLSFTDMINNNFAYAEVHDKLYEMAAIYEKPMVKTYHRFNGGEYTEDTFWDNIAVIDEFYEKRADKIVPYFAKALGLSGEVGEVTLETACMTGVSYDGAVSDEAGGTVLLNTIAPDFEKGVWRGSYFTDYPVTVTAVPAEGYRFVGWQGDCESEETVIEVDVTGEGICLRAVFAPEEP